MQQYVPLNIKYNKKQQQQQQQQGRLFTGYEFNVLPRPTELVSNDNDNDFHT